MMDPPAARKDINTPSALGGKPPMLCAFVGPVSRSVVPGVSDLETDWVSSVNVAFADVMLAWLMPTELGPVKVTLTWALDTLRLVAPGAKLSMAGRVLANTVPQVRLPETGNAGRNLAMRYCGLPSCVRVYVTVDRSERVSRN